MANTNDSFIDEVAEAVRRERLNLWFRRWGWLIALLVLAIVGTAAALEWRESRTATAAQARGDALLSALETEEPEARLAALSALPVQGEDGMVAAFLLAADQSQGGEAEAAAQTLTAVAQDSSIPAVYRDLAALKAAMVLGPQADRASLEALATPGAPYRLLAAEQLAILDLQSDRRDDGIAGLRAIFEDAEVSGAQQSRVSALLTALGAPPEAEPAPTEAAADATTEAEPAAPAEE